MKIEVTADVVRVLEPKLLGEKQKKLGTARVLYGWGMGASNAT